MPKPLTLAVSVTLLLAAVFGAWWILGRDSGSRDPEDGKPPSGKPHVFLISVDTLRADRLSCYGYTKSTSPAIDALARDGILFQSCFTPNPLTLPAHTSMLTGTSPIFHRVRDNTFTVVPADGMKTMAEEFASNGYSTAGFVSSIVMESASGISRGFAHWDDRLPNVPGGSGLLMPERNAEQTLAAAAEWVKAQPAGKPLFVFIHLFDPHFPYHPPGPEYSKGLVSPVAFTPEELSPWYDAEVRYADAKLGAFFDGLKAQGLWDHSVLALTADHGEGLGDGGELTHGYFIHAACTHVPLILKLPADRPVKSRVATAVTTTDLMPTLAGIAGLSLSELATRQVQGDDLMPFVLGQRDGANRQVYVESHYGHNNAGWARLRGLWGASSLIVLHPESPEFYRFDGNTYHPLPVNLVASIAGAKAGDQAEYNAARERVSHLLATWYNPNIRQVLRPGSTASYPDETKPGSKPAYYGESKPAYYGESKPAVYAAEATPYPGESINRAPIRQESLTDDQGLPSAHTKAQALAAYQQAELLFSRGKFAMASGKLSILLESEPLMLPALRLASRSESSLASASARDRQLSADHIRKAAAFASRAAAAARELKLDLAALDIQASAYLWRIMLGEHEAIRDEALAVLQDTKTSMTVEVHDRYQRLVHLAAYRIAGSDAAKRIEIGKRLSQSLKDRKSHQQLIDLMMGAKAIPLAPWEVGQ